MHGVQVQHEEVTSVLPIRAGTKPILRWVGGKKWLVPLVSPGIWNALAVTGGLGRYIEPFLGGGAIALDLGLPHMQLSDACSPLIQTYRAVVSDWQRVRRTVEKMVSNVGGTINKKTYYDIRNLRVSGDYEAAAKFIILNVTCFNGIYRENASGAFNVPYGDRTEKHLPGPEAYQAVAVALATSRITTEDFRVAVDRARRDDVVYADPPYFSTFTSYTAGGFSAADQEDLARGLKRASDRGAVVLATNIDCPEVRELYAGFEIVSTAEARKVNSNTAGRGAVGCVLVTNRKFPLLTVPAHDGSSTLSALRGA
jgi:DNA adenine methylase